MFKAIQRVFFGLAFSKHVLVEELLTTAYHEAGHAMVCYYRNLKERVQIVTIVPSGYALGYMWGVSKEDYNKKSKQEYLVDMEISLGGYAAEELFSETTHSGVSADLENVGRVARAMVRNYGMGSFKFNVSSAYEKSEYGASDQTNREIELEIKTLVNDCLENVQSLLRSKRSELDRFAHALMEKETLYYKDIVAILEPNRTSADVERELETLADRKLVGKPPVVNIDEFGVWVLPGTGTGGGASPGSSTNNDVQSTEGENGGEKRMPPKSP
jgi:cell division protease FtsH